MSNCVYGIVFWLFVSSYAQAAKYFQRALKCLDQEVGKKTGDRAGHSPGTEDKMKRMEDGGSMCFSVRLDTNQIKVVI